MPSVCMRNGIPDPEGASVSSDPMSIQLQATVISTASLTGVTPSPPGTGNRTLCHCSLRLLGTQVRKLGTNTWLGQKQSEKREVNAPSWNPGLGVPGTAEP